MSLVIEDNFIELQRETTRVLVLQKVILSEEEENDIFLDKVNATKKEHTDLLSNYSDLIEKVVLFLEGTHSVENLISVSEAINNLVDTTKRLIKSLSEEKTRQCFNHEVIEYTILLNDIREISFDIVNRTMVDHEMSNLLKKF